MKNQTKVLQILRNVGFPLNVSEIKTRCRLGEWQIRASLQDLIRRRVVITHKEARSKGGKGNAPFQRTKYGCNKKVMPRINTIIENAEKLE